jgi:hypothetical protein
MANPKEQVLRATLSERMSRAIKRQRYTERHIEQILRVTPDRAKALHAGVLDEFSVDELQRFLMALE